MYSFHKLTLFIQPFLEKKTKSIKNVKLVDFAPLFNIRCLAIFAKNVLFYFSFAANVFQLGKTSKN
jgi:hypothetical protein